MAFEQINEYTKTLKAEWLKCEEALSLPPSSDPETKEARKRLYEKQRTIFNCMIDYEQTVLSNKKFSAQKKFMKQCILEINPGFARGYYKMK